MNEVRPLRLLLKALLLFAVINWLFAALNPAVGKLSLYNRLIPGRGRLPYEDAEYEGRGHSLMLYEDFDAMFASHVISRPDRPAGEFRVVLIGDSSVWGYNLAEADTLASQLNAMHISCEGRTVVTYDLAYVGLYLPKDLLILDRAAAYKPDLVIWFTTLEALLAGGRTNVNLELLPHADRSLALIRKYGLNLDTYGMRAPSLWDRALWAQRSRLKKLLLLQLDGLLWDATDIDFYLRTLPAVAPDMSRDPVHGSRDDRVLSLSDLPFDVLSAGYEISSPAPVLAVNEPIYVASGNASDPRYNSYYPRRIYDQYRLYMQQWFGENGRPYLDLWDLIPAAEFRDTPLHYSAAGERMLAARLAPEIERFVCP
jgi:hypothetical protein